MNLNFSLTTVNENEVMNEVEHSFFYERKHFMNELICLSYNFFSVAIIIIFEFLYKSKS